MATPRQEFIDRAIRRLNYAYAAHVLNNTHAAFAISLKYDYDLGVFIQETLQTKDVYTEKAEKWALGCDQKQWLRAIKEIRRIW